MMGQFEIIRSKRRTIAIEIKNIRVLLFEFRWR